MVDSCVRGFHVYQDIWTPTTGERLSCQTEDSNAFDPYAVAIRKSAHVIGHVPRKISAACSLFIQRGDTLTCIIIDSCHQYSADLPQGGLQIPCKLEFKCDHADLLSNIKKLVRSALPIDFELKHHTPAVVPKRKLKVKLVNLQLRSRNRQRKVWLFVWISPPNLPVTLLKKIHGLPLVDAP